MRGGLTGIMHFPKVRSKGEIYKGGTKPAKADMMGRRVREEGYPVPHRAMSEEEIERYFTESSITCLLCGKEYRAINTAHLVKVHSVTMDEYRNFYGLPYSRGLICKELLRTRMEQGKDKTPNLKPVGKKRRPSRLNAYAINKRKENMKIAKAFHTKLSDEDRVKIINEYAKGKVTQYELAEKYNVSQSAISQVITPRRQPSCGGRDDND